MLNNDLVEMMSEFVLNYYDDFIEDGHVYCVYCKIETLCNGRYIIEKRLGKGSEGIVYLARDTKDNNQL